MIHVTAGLLLFEQGHNKWQIQETHLLPWEEQHGSPPQESAGFGNSKWGRVPETKMLSHRPGEHRQSAAGDEGDRSD